MKKYLVIIFLACTAVSCIGEKVDPNAWKQTVKATITTKTPLVWEKKDAIVLFRGNDFPAGFSISEGIGAAEGTFSRVLTEPEEVNTNSFTAAFYPYSKDVELNVAQRKISVKLNDCQEFGKKEKALIAYVTNGEAREIEMRSILGYVQIPIIGAKDGIEVSQIRFKTLGSEALTGKVSIGLSTGSITFSDEEVSNEIVLTAENVRLSTSSPVVFEIALPNRVLRSGYEVLISSPDGTSMTCQLTKGLTVNQDRTVTLDEIVYEPSRFGDKRVDYIVDECKLPGAYILDGNGEIKSIVMDPEAEDAVYNSKGVFRIQNYEKQQVFLFSGVTPRVKLGQEVDLTLGGNYVELSSMAANYKVKLVKTDGDTRWLYAPGQAVFIVQTEE